MNINLQINFNSPLSDLAKYAKKLKNELISSNLSYFRVSTIKIFISGNIIFCIKGRFWN